MRLLAPVPAATALVVLGGVKRTFQCEELLSAPIGAAALSARFRPQRLVGLQLRL
jgi:hypothetical protein